MRGVAVNNRSIFFGLSVLTFFSVSIYADDYIPEGSNPLTGAVSSGFTRAQREKINEPIPVPKGHPLDVIASWMAKLEWDEIEPFYGAALPLRATEDRLFFVHNYHELPKSKKKLAGLKERGKWGNFEPYPAYVAGYHIGYDTAVTYVKKKFTASEVQLINRMISNFYYRADLHKNVWRIGVLGIPGPWTDPRQVFKNLLWSTESDILAVWDNPNEFLGDTIDDLFSPSRKAIPVELRTDCPPVFLAGCYRVPMRTWGYSGGAFILGDTSRNQDGERFIIPRIAGIPSHFVPLTESTYIIPADTILHWGDLIVKPIL